MKTRLLNQTEFMATFAEPMRDVLASETNVIDIWPYVAAISTSDPFDNTIVDGCVEQVHRNGNGTFDHVLVPTMTKNTFLAVVVDLVYDSVLGHYLLDLNREYGLE